MIKFFIILIAAISLPVYLLSIGYGLTLIHDTAGTGFFAAAVFSHIIVAVMIAFLFDTQTAQRQNQHNAR